MPYTKEEVLNGEVNFYNQLVNKLREKYFRELVNSAKPKTNNRPKPFRDFNNVLYSFEDIDINEDFGINLGIESAQIMGNPNYTILESELGRQKLEAQDFGAEQGELGGEGSTMSAGATLEELYGDDYVTPSEGFIPWVKEYSKSVQNKSLKENIKTADLDKLIDRSFSELINVEVADSLPDGIVNGDVVTLSDPTDIRKWLIEGNQKRIFPDLSTFYGYVENFDNLVTRSIDVLDEIPDGEPVD